MLDTSLRRLVFSRGAASLRTGDMLDTAQGSERRPDGTEASLALAASPFGPVTCWTV